MAAVTALFATLVALVFTFAFPQDINKVEVDVYYESLCPDSRRFFINQLWPVYQEMSSYIDLNLIPYGNAHVVGEPGSYTYTCQHGAEECYGNIAQTCFINLFNDTVESIKFINCAFTSDTQQNSITECIKSKKIQNAVRKCAEGAMGGDLEYDMAQKTSALDPPQTFIPWITFNKEGSAIMNRKANRDFRTVLCDHITGDKPSVCEPKKKHAKRNRERQLYL